MIGVDARILGGLVAACWIVLPAYLSLPVAFVVGIGSRLGIENFPSTGVREFRLRFRAPDGTHFDTTEQYALGILDAIGKHVSPQNIDITLESVGTISSSFPIHGVY